MERPTPTWAALPAVLYLLVAAATGAHLAVDTGSSVSRVDPEYVSVTLDFQLIATPPGVPRWYTFDSRSPRVITLLKGLSPCYLRFGGSQADMTVLSEPPSSDLYNLPTALKLNTIYRSDIDRLVELTRAAGGRLLYDLNLNVRYAGGWDPTNAHHIMGYMASRGYGENVDFELGNEPDLSKANIVPPWPYPPAMQTEPDAYKEPALLSGKQIGADYLTLKALIDTIPNFKASKLVGADIVTPGGLQNLMPDFLKIAGGNITATTFHQYYFKGLGAHPSDYIKPLYFDSIRYNIGVVKSLVKSYSPRKDLPIWIGETADAWHSGTQNVSDRYISGFLWLDKLGLSAQLGVTVVMRQTFYGGFYALINGQLYPNPDYWVSYLHKQLVGRTVFNTTVKDSSKGQGRPLGGENDINKMMTSLEVELVRLYAHCTKPSARYTRGALTIFGLNLKNETEAVTFDPALANQKVDQYVLTPGGQDGLLSKEIALNGHPLHLIDDVTLPPLTPVTMATASSGVKLPGLTFAFWVFPDANVTACNSET